MTTVKCPSIYAVERVGGGGGGELYIVPYSMILAKTRRNEGYAK